MFCTACGNEIPEGAQFCTKCGAAAPSKTADAQPAQPSQNAATTYTPPNAQPPAPQTYPAAGIAKPRTGMKVVAVLAVIVAVAVVALLIATLLGIGPFAPTAPVQESASSASSETSSSASKSSESAEDVTSESKVEAEYKKAVAANPSSEPCTNVNSGTKLIALTGKVEVVSSKNPDGSAAKATLLVLPKPLKVTGSKYGEYSSDSIVISENNDYKQYDGKRVTMYLKVYIESSASYAGAEWTALRSASNGRVDRVYD